MLFELAFETVRPGNLPALLNALEVAAKARDGQYGTLVGAWTTEVGTLNRCVTLWRYDHTAHQENVVTALARNSDWQAYEKSIQPVLASRTRRTLTPLRSVRGRAEGNQLYELRTYDVLPGRLAEYMNYVSGAIEDREKRSPNFGFWSLTEGNPDKFLHLWAYRDFNHRLEVRRGALTDPSWQKYLSQAQPIIRRQRSVLMIPTAFSPLK
jgi:hypothetical protein